MRLLTILFILLLFLCSVSRGLLKYRRLTFLSFASCVLTGSDNNVEFLNPEELGKPLRPEPQQQSLTLWVWVVLGFWCQELQRKPVMGEGYVLLTLQCLRKTGRSLLGPSPNPYTASVACMCICVCVFFHCLAQDLIVFRGPFV